jgi:hypothetical protein
MFLIQELDKVGIDVHFDRRNLIPGQHLWTQIGGAITDPAVCDAIKRIEGRLDKESQLRKTIEFLKGKIVPEF